MKTLLNRKLLLVITGSAALFAAVCTGSASASVPSKKHAKKHVAVAASKRKKQSKKSTTSQTFVGDGLRRKKSLEFDGRSVEALRPGQYDSVSHLSEGDSSLDHRLYALPRDFKDRTADATTEMRYDHE